MRKAHFDRRNVTVKITFDTTSLIAPQKKPLRIFFSNNTSSNKVQHLARDGYAAPYELTCPELYDQKHY